jgi:hypothetical protein
MGRKRPETCRIAATLSVEALLIACGAILTAMRPC